MEEQTRLQEVSEVLAQKLVFYTDADRIAQKLQSPTLAVNSDTFLRLMDRIDECYTYVLDHVSALTGNPA